MTTKYGMFMEHAYLKPGMVNASAVASDSDAAATSKSLGETGAGDRDNGLNFKCTVARTGKGNDAVFGKLEYIAVPYVDPLKARLQAEAKSATRNLVDKPFKTAHTLPKSSTPGDYYGTSGKIPHMAADPSVGKKKGEIAGAPRGIFTSPAKKGSFGFNKLTLSQRAGPKGIATEYEYLHDPDTLRKQKELEELEADRKARVTELPFKPSNPPKKGGPGVPNTTISKGKGVAGEWEYISAPPDAGRDASPDRKKPDEGAPFKPTNQFAHKRMHHIEYIHDPELPKLTAAHEAKINESKKLATTGAWKPNQSYKTDMVRSIVRMNLR